MNLTNNTEILGHMTIVLSSLLGGYYLLLKIKGFYQESPDPKLTYATIQDLKDLRTSHNQTNKETKTDLQQLRSELKHDVYNLIKDTQSTIKITQHFVQKNAQHIASLITQTNSNKQRIAEISIKLDRTSEKINTKN